MKVLIVSLIILAVIGFFGWKSSRFGYESARYELIEKHGPFEIRNYPAMTLATTTMDNPDPEDGGTFMRLFRYIAKGNEAEEKIAMTTPVFMSSGEGAEMSFVVPDDVAERGAPAPKSKKVRVSEVTMGKVAAYRYSGSWSQESKNNARAKLNEWLKEKGLESNGEMYSAGYDPPFTPKFMRRNEVLVGLEG